ncbi:HAD family phosphatase [Patulibacter sp.]|uniref:HAD family hydrolase n=1 Tax=Patulibacter sp. TaxID=1912859 RepID=UPI0027201772|nr:beta-phosphoglucomutase family hydrolase [Patulibacter sp.]MDO9410415.1 beta-phosphoglucomutase family hydrolase [Patulibacter sp.]
MTQLPDAVRACLFDMDGVLTDTARIHAAAWKDAFDAFLTARAGAEHGPDEDLRPFDARADYEAHVDGLPREDGVRAFLASRGIELPEGTADDGPDVASVTGIATAKNDRVGPLIDREGVELYPGTVVLLDALDAEGVPYAVVSSSANTRHVLEAAGALGRFAAIVDGTSLASRGLKGKPAPDTFLAAAENLGVAPADAAVFEDALSGVQAGRDGHFGLVVGVDRVGHADALREHGAGLVVADLAELA